jgi:hypothetical protein
MFDSDGEPTTTLRLGESFDFRIDFTSSASLKSPRIILGIDDAMGGRLLSLVTPLNESAPQSVIGPCTVQCKVPHFPLAPGSYTLRLRILEGNGELVNIDHALAISVIDAEAFGSGHGFWAGTCVAPAAWSVHSRLHTLAN